ncbi:MAG: squalene/phytoene synthase family protein [Alphaproteobacteria bacterium]|nr:squalene/phytoene synthase family protein [Alphaproteobacteria bacterium]
MADDTDFCADQVRRFDHDRYLTALFAPAAARPALLALYAFNVEVARVRETVSEPLIGQIRLQWWRDAIAELAGGRARKHPVVEALTAVLARGVRPDDFETLLLAREQDLTDEPPATLAALEAYAEGTSGSLARMAATILGGTDAAAQEAARQVGTAWALTGTLRAVPFLARQRRSRLPADLVAQAGLDIDAMYEGRPGPPLAPVARAIADAATARLVHARALRAHRHVHAALLPATLADLHLRRLRRRGFALFDPALLRPAGGAGRLVLAALLRRY